MRVPLSKVSVPGRLPLTSPKVAGEPANAPSEEKLRIWSEADCETNVPGLKLKSSDPAVPLMLLVLTETISTTGFANAVTVKQNKATTNLEIISVQTPGINNWRKVDQRI